MVGKNIQDFSIDITSDICYFVTNDSEQIFTTKDLQNYSIEDIRIPNDFKTTNDSTNTASEDLQVYTVSADENVFIVTKNQDTLKYKAICDAEKEFIYACAITDNLHLLIGQDEIDEINILNATKKALHMAISNLKVKPDIILVDALEHIDTLGIPYESIIKGDAKSYSIAAASILAKVTRDRLMLEYDKKYPLYQFAKQISAWLHLSVWYTMQMRQSLYV